MTKYTLRQVAKELGYEVTCYRLRQSNEWILRKKKIAFTAIGSPSDGYKLWANTEFMLPKGLPVELYKYGHDSFAEWRLASTERLNCWAVINREELEQILKLN